MQVATTATFSIYLAYENPSFLNQKYRTAILKAKPFSILLAPFHHFKAKGKHSFVKNNIKFQQSCLMLLLTSLVSKSYIRLVLLNVNTIILFIKKLYKTVFLFNMTKFYLSEMHALNLQKAQVNLLVFIF